MLAWENPSDEGFDRELAKLRADYEHRLRELLTDDAATRAAAITEKYRTAWGESLVTAIGDPAQMVGTRQQLRSAIDESLRADVADYAAIRALQATFTADYRNLAGKYSHGGAGGLAVHPPVWLGDLDVFGLEEFAPPFEVSDLYAFPTGPPIDGNRSATFPDLGLVLNDITWRDDNTFDVMYDTSGFARSDVAVGINFEAPKTGLLNVAVIMRNTYNRIQVSGTDNFGFSSANVTLSHNVFVLALRDSDSLIAQQSVISDGWISPGGDDFSFVFPDVPEGPVVLVANFQDPLGESEQLQILAGSDTTVLASVSNMDCTATAKMLWQVEMLYVWMT